MAKTEYNNISREYKASKLLGFRKYIEEYTLFQLLGNLKGKKVLDLACGEGIYTRKIMEAGASAAVGVDLSEGMIKLAQEEEKKNPLGCTYLVNDAARLEKLDEFDIVVASYLLNYATKREELSLFAQAIYKNLKKGGLFIGFNNNPSDHTDSDTTYRKYHFTKKCPKGTGEGAPVVYTFYNADGTVFQLENYLLSRQLHTEVFKSEGFASFDWVRPILAPEGLKHYAPNYWDEFLAKKPVYGIRATK